MPQDTSPASTELVTELDLGSACGGKAGINKRPVSIEIVRSLAPEDLPYITNPPPVAAPQVTVRSLRHSHHRLAELVAKGLPGTEISAITGYSQSYLSTLQTDPAFEELVAYYAEQNRVVYVDAMERLAALGIDAMEKVQELLSDPAKTWTAKELTDLIKMAVVEPHQIKAQPKPGEGGSANLNLNVTFVGAKPVGDASAVLDGDFKQISE